MKPGKTSHVPDIDAIRLEMAEAYLHKRFMGLPEPANPETGAAGDGNLPVEYFRCKIDGIFDGYVDAPQELIDPRFTAPHRLGAAEVQQLTLIPNPDTPYLSTEPKPGVRKPLTRKARKLNKKKNRIRAKSRKVNRK